MPVDRHANKYRHTSSQGHMCTLVVHSPACVWWRGVKDRECVSLKERDWKCFCVWGRKSAPFIWVFPCGSIYINDEPWCLCRCCFARLRAALSLWTMNYVCHPTVFAVFWQLTLCKSSRSHLGYYHFVIKNGYKLVNNQLITKWSFSDYLINPLVTLPIKKLINHSKFLNEKLFLYK